MKKFLHSKYKEIIISAALFVMLDAGILSLNFFTSYQISNDTHAIQLASRQTTLTQKILHQLYQVREELITNNPIDESVEHLTKSFSQFDEALDSFIYGGELIGQGQGQDSLLVNAEYSQENKNTLEGIQNIWKSYRVLISPVIYSIYNPEANLNDIILKADQAVKFGRDNNDELLLLSNDFAHAVESIVQDKAAHLRTIQTLGIFLAIINFFIVLFHFLRKLRKSDELTEKSRKETSEILGTVNDGLFLMDEKLHILPQYSTSLKGLLQEEKISGRNFLQLLKPMVSGKTLGIAKEYLESMFSKHVSPELLEDLNPLNEVEIHITTRNGDFETRYFAFSFSPVRERGRLIHLLVVLRDISDRIILQRELDKSKNESSQQLNHLISVIHLNHNSFLDFLVNLQNMLIQINDLLRKPTYLNKQYQNKVKVIAQIAHKIKGESSLIGFEALETNIHRFESIISSLSNKKNLSGNDFLPITIELNKLDQYVGSLQKLVGHVVEFKKELKYPNKSNHNHLINNSCVSFSESIDKNTLKESWKENITKLSDKIARQYNKHVLLDLEDFNQNIIPSDLLETIQTIVIQFLRNAIVHGIENVDVRDQCGKNKQALIKISVKQIADKLWLNFHDDGQGINLNAIKGRLKEKHAMSKKHIESMRKSQLISYLFKHGFSTAKQLDIHAGRGIGLELVKNLLKPCNAKLSVDFKSGEFTEFKICFSVAHDKVIQEQHKQESLAALM